MAFVSRATRGCAVGVLAAGALAVSGCASSAASAPPGAHAIALLAGGGSEAAAAALRCGARREATRLGYRLSVRGPADASASEQISSVDAVIAAGSSGPAAVVLAPRNASALEAPVRSLRSAGTTVVELGPDPGSAARAYREGLGAVGHAVSELERRPVAVPAARAAAGSRC